MKRQLKKLLLLSRLPQALTRIGPRRAVILRYHSVQSVPADYANTIGKGIIHSEAVFRQQMEVVARHFNPVTMDDITSWLDGAAQLPRRAVAITFDDGFADNYETAVPILARYGLRAAFYVTVGSIGNGQEPWFCRLRRAFHSTSVPRWIEPSTGQAYDDSGGSAGRRNGFLAACRTCAVLTGDRQEEFLNSVEGSLQVRDFPGGSPLMMDWEQVAALHRAGHIIGSHTLTHPNLAHIAHDEMLRELWESKSVLTERLGIRIQHFSYPSPILEPHCSEETTALVEEAGYASAVTCFPGPVLPNRSPLLLPRVSAPQDMDEFLWTLEASLAGCIL
jgi:peptidoglycan/xylan/chitin deacetylase (PgdA/CDA1 family)